MRKEELHIGIVASIIGGLILSYSKPIALGVATMLYEILHTPVDFFWVALTISVSALVFVLIIQKYGERLAEKTQQYNKLLKQIKLSRPIKMSISIEEKGKPIIQTGYGTFPHLNFDMRVINRTYYPLKPEEATIQCFCGSEQVRTPITWNKKVQTPDIETYISINGLLKYDEGYIDFHVPIEKIYDDLSEWKLRGSVKYELDEGVVRDLQLENGVELEIDLKYELPEDKQRDLRKKIENALASKR